MILNKIFICGMFFVCCVPVAEVSAVESYDGVLISSPNPAPKPYPRPVYQSSSAPQEKKQQTQQHQKRAVSKDQQSLIQEYAREIVLFQVLEETRTLMKRAVETQNLQLFPAIINFAMQEIVQECFNHATTREMIERAFEETFDFANELIDEGASGKIVQQKVKSKVIEMIHPITKEYIYQQIFQEIMRQSFEQQQRMIIMKVAERQAQMAVIQQRYAAMQQMVKKQYEKMVEEVIKQKIQQYREQQMRLQMQRQKYPQGF